jgi:hypothetical protein
LPISGAIDGVIRRQVFKMSDHCALIPDGAPLTAPIDGRCLLPKSFLSTRERLMIEITQCGTLPPFIDLNSHRQRDLLSGDDLSLIVSPYRDHDVAPGHVAFHVWRVGHYSTGRGCFVCPNCVSSITEPKRLNPRGCSATSGRSFCQETDKVIPC